MATSRPVIPTNVYSTVQAGSTAIGSASATGINVATGDGANFGTLNTDEFIPAGIFDTSTNPETLKEIVWITARSTDALTVTRQAELSSRYPASTSTIQAGYTIAAVDTALSSTLRAAARDIYTKPNGVFAETWSRTNISTGTLTPTSGTLYLAAIVLPEGLNVGRISVMFPNGATSPTHWWFGLYDRSKVQLAVTADQTTTAIASSSYTSLAIATTAAGAATSYVTTYTGIYYVGVMQAASTPATLTATSVSVTLAMGQAASLGGVSDTGQTTPPAFPHTAGASASANTIFYANVGA